MLSADGASPTMFEASSQYSGCEVYDAKKGLLYQGTFEDGIRSMFAVGGNRYYLVGNRSVRVIKLK